MTPTADSIDRRVVWCVLGVPALLCLVALADLPYGYYTLLRIVTSLGALAAAYWLARIPSAFALLFLAMLVLFNPIVPFRLSREAWAVIDVVAAVCLVLAAARISVRARVGTAATNTSVPPKHRAAIVAEDVSDSRVAAVSVLLWLGALGILVVVVAVFLTVSGFLR